MYILHLKNFPIYKQLQLEEALLRYDARNFCILNEGSPPAIVMGISGKIEDAVHIEKLEKNPIPVIKRFSGGGTVVVDENTLFISFICQRDFVDFTPFPEPIMRWTEELYRQALLLSDFSLIENDYVIGQKKFGGNAQYIRKNRWAHHSTLLWDYTKELMELLLFPKKTPSYRAERTHEEFLTKLSEHIACKHTFLRRFKTILHKQFAAKELPLELITDTLQNPQIVNRQATQLLQRLSANSFHCQKSDLSS